MLTENQNLPNIADKLGLSALYFKREDKHPLFSHKGRSIPHMVDHYIKQGVKKFVISSSGNSALASALYIKKINQETSSKIQLQIFVNQNINKEKEQKLYDILDENIKIEKVEKPKQKMIEFGNNGYQILRQSNDDLALVGYKKIAEEILEIPNLKNVFFPVSSGALIQGVSKNLPTDIKIFAIQTEKCNPIAKEFDSDFVNGDSIADAIIDNVAFRKQKITDLIKNHTGSGFVVQNNLIEKAQGIYKAETGEILSPNGILAFAGLLKALAKGIKIKGPVCCIITGF